MRSSSRISCLLLVISFFLSSPWCEISYGDDLLPAGPQSLIDKYHKLGEELKKSPFTMPFLLESSESENASRVDIYSTINYPFATIKDELLEPTNWCEMVLPHPDIRACTYEKLRDTWLLNIYSVNKFSKPLEEAYQMKFVYRISDMQPSYFDVALTAHEGPFHTQDHQFGFEVAPLSSGLTFIHLSYSFGYTSWGYFLMKIFGGGKVGFSVIDKDRDGNPVYVSGPRGSAERNGVRFYLAILAYLDTRKIPAGQRFEKQISEWYDMAALYRRQLLEMEKFDYLSFKRQDRRSQQTLQGDRNR